MTRVLAVIHHRDVDTSLANAAIAEASGCAGVILIQMEGRDHEIDEPALLIKERHPNLLVGANRLSAKAWEAVLRDSDLGLDATWADEPGASSAGPGPHAARIRAALARARERNRDFMFFGSVAFKTQEPEADPAGAARVAMAEGWTVTTSGPRTGTPPSAGKLAAMAAAVGPRRLAVASGIDPTNAVELARHVGWVLVATGIGRNFHEFDPGLTSALVLACRNHGVPQPTS